MHSVVLNVGGKIQLIELIQVDPKHFRGNGNRIAN